MSIEPMQHTEQDRIIDGLTPAQIRRSAAAWHEIADMVEQAATDEEIAAVARATVFRDQYGVRICACHS